MGEQRAHGRRTPAPRYAPVQQVTMVGVPDAKPGVRAIALMLELTDTAGPAVTRTPLVMTLGAAGMVVAALMVYAERTGLLGELEAEAGRSLARMRAGGPDEWVPRGGWQPS